MKEKRFDLVRMLEDIKQENTNQKESVSKPLTQKDIDELVNERNEIGKHKNPVQNS